MDLRRAPADHLERLGMSKPVCFRAIVLLFLIRPARSSKGETLVPERGGPPDCSRSMSELSGAQRALELCRAELAELSESEWRLREAVSELQKLLAEARGQKAT